MTCPKCGETHAAAIGGRPCTGHANVKDDDGRIIGSRPCKKPAMTGLPTCNTHGGQSQTGMAASRRRGAEAKAAAIARKLIPDLADRTAITNPLETLLELASEANAFRESLRVMANDLDGKIRYAAGAGSGEQLRAEVATYRQALKDTTDLLVAIARLDIEKMLARIEARKVEFVLDAITAGLNAAALDEEKKRAVIAGVTRHLRSVRHPAA